MSDLASEVDVSKATLYYHFPSKSLLLQRILQRLATAMTSAVQADSGCSPSSGLRQCTEQLLGAMALNADSVAIYYRERPFLSERLPAHQRENIHDSERVVYQHIRGLIARGIATGEFRSCDVHVLTLGYLGMMLSCHHCLASLQQSASSSVSAEISNTFLRGLTRSHSR